MSAALSTPAEDDPVTADEMVAVAEELGLPFTREMAEAYLAGKDAAPPGEPDGRDDVEFAGEPDGPSVDRDELFGECYDLAIATFRRLMHDPNPRIAFLAAAEIIRLQTTYMRTGRAAVLAPLSPRVKGVGDEGDVRKDFPW